VFVQIALHEKPTKQSAMLLLCTADCVEGFVGVGGAGWLDTGGSRSTRLHGTCVGCMDTRTEHTTCDGMNACQLREQALQAAAMLPNGGGLALACTTC
jgi:hypothetical protein